MWGSRGEARRRYSPPARVPARIDDVGDFGDPAAPPTGCEPSAAKLSWPSARILAPRFRRAGPPEAAACRHAAPMPSGQRAHAPPAKRSSMDYIPHTDGAYCSPDRCARVVAAVVSLALVLLALPLDRSEFEPSRQARGLRRPRVGARVVSEPGRLWKMSGSASR